MNPHPGILVLAYVTPRSGRAPEIEAITHRLLRRWRRHGEWFNVTARHAQNAIEEATAEDSRGRTPPAYVAPPFGEICSKANTLMRAMSVIDAVANGDSYSTAGARYGLSGRDAQHIFRSVTREPKVRKGLRIRTRQGVYELIEDVSGHAG
jgi:hypothetical protein